MSTEQEIKEVVNRWCPSAFDAEQFGVRAIRAMLEMRAYILDKGRMDRGLTPIRPLDSYPSEPEPA
jgi:hypothetical protein